MRHGRILGALVLFLSVRTFAYPNPQEGDQDPPKPPPPGSKPPGFLASLTSEEEDKPPKDEMTPLAPPENVSVNAELNPETTDEKEEFGDCGPACMLVNQTPIILLICVLVLVILLLILLFGCYFMSKLHGKAIYTTEKRHPNTISSGKDAEFSKERDMVRQTKTYESFSPGSNETKNVVTTTTTKIIQSGTVGKDFSSEPPMRTEV